MEVKTRYHKSGSINIYYSHLLYRRTGGFSDEQDMHKVGAMRTSVEP